MKVRMWCCLAAALLLSGCANYQAQKVAQAAQFAAENAKEECSFAFKDPAIDPIRSKVTNNGVALTLAQLSDDAYPRPDEKPAIDALMKAYTSCSSAQMDVVQRFGSYEIPAITRRDESTQSLVAKFYAGHLTFGQFNTKHQKILSDFKTEYATARSQNEIQQRELAAQEMQARAAAFSAIHPYTPTPIYVPPMQTYHPVTTTCQHVLGQFQCTSY